MQSEIKTQEMQISLMYLKKNQFSNKLQLDWMLFLTLANYWQFTFNVSIE